MNKKALLASLFALFLVGCGTNQQPPQADYNHKPMRDQLFGVGPVNHKWTRSGDGIRYSFETNQDPQRIHNLSDMQYSLSDDQDKMRQIVLAEKGMDPGMVAVIGDRAYVHVSVPEKMKKKDAKIDDLRAKLKTAMPRYDVRLIIADK